MPAAVVSMVLLALWGLWELVDEGTTAGDPDGVRFASLGRLARAHAPPLAVLVLLGSVDGDVTSQVFGVVPLNPGLLLLGVALLWSARRTGGGDTRAVPTWIALVAGVWALTLAATPDRNIYSILWLPGLPVAAIYVVRRVARDHAPLHFVHLALSGWFLALFGGPLLESRWDLDFAEYHALPFYVVSADVVAWWLARAVRLAGAGRVDARRHSVRLIGPLRVTLRPWQLFLGWMLAAAIVTTVTEAPPGTCAVAAASPALPVATVGAWIALGTATRLVPEAPLPARPPFRDVAYALLPLAAPALAFALVHLVDGPPEWTDVVKSRGQVAALAESLPVPLLGAALVAAGGVDRVFGLRASRFVLGLGLALLAAALVPIDFDPELRDWSGWLGPERSWDRLATSGLDTSGLARAAAVAIALSTAAVRVRLRLVRRGGSPSRAALALAAGLALVVAQRALPHHGPVAAWWATSAGLAALLALDAFSGSLRPAP